MMWAFLSSSMTLDGRTRWPWLFSGLTTLPSFVPVYTWNSWKLCPRLSEWVSVLWLSLLHFVLFIPVCSLALVCLTCFLVIYITNYFSDIIRSLLCCNIASFLCISIVLLSLDYGTILMSYAVILTESSHYLSACWVSNNRLSSRS